MVRIDILTATSNQLPVDDMKSIGVYEARFYWTGENVHVMWDMLQLFVFMMTSSNKNIFRVTDTLCGEFTDHRWISLTKANDAEL